MVLIQQSYAFRDKEVEDWRENQRTDIYIVKQRKYSGYVVAYEFVGGMMEERAAYDLGINNVKIN